jgi:hypothetical protein
VPSDSFADFVYSRIPDAEIHLNDTEDFALCIEKKEQASGLVRFAVIRVTDRKIVKEGHFRPGYVKWINNDKIEILNLPGAFRENEDLEKYKTTILVRSTKS